MRVLLMLCSTSLQSSDLQDLLKHLLPKLLPPCSPPLCVTFICSRLTLSFQISEEPKKAYELTMKLTDIHNIRGIKDAARLKLVKWSNEVEELGVDNFYIVINTFENHYQTILNFFVNRATNAKAESFNAKVKAFRAQFRGVTDIPFFLYRLMKLCA